MSWTITSPILKLSYRDDEIVGDINIVDAYMKASDNTIAMPTVNAYVEYDSTDPVLAYWAAVMMLDELGAEWEETGDLPEEPEYESPPGAKF